MPRPEAESGFGSFLYNGDTGEVLGRTAASWGKIGLFYLIYYAGLTAFFIGLLAIFLKVFSDDKAPVLTGKYSVLPPNPAMGYQPMIVAEKTLITYSTGDPKAVKKYTDAMWNYLKTGQAPDRMKSPIKAVNYINPDTEKSRECVKGDVTESRDTIPCVFRANDTGFDNGCTANGFGYADGFPCIAIKMNRIYEFIPKIKDDGDEIEIQCRGEHVADRDNIGSKIKYWPPKTFANGSIDSTVGTIKKYYFPFLGQPNYMTPLVFVKFENVVPNVLVQVVCKPLNVENIKSTKDKEGQGHFEIYITT